YCGATSDCMGANAGATCSAGQLCMGGQCEVFCPPGFVDCGGACVDPSSNNTYCGATSDCSGMNAGTTCTATELCEGGACLGHVPELLSLSIAPTLNLIDFDPNTTFYTAGIPIGATQVTVVVTADPSSVVTMDGQSTSSLT